MTTPPPPARIQHARIQFTGSAAAPPARSPDVDQSDPPSDLTAAALLALIPDWQLAPRAENNALGTILVYTDGGAALPGLVPAHPGGPDGQGDAADLDGAPPRHRHAPGTVRTRHQAVGRFTVWVVAIGALQTDPFWGIKVPAHHQTAVTPLSDDELRALIGTCTHPTFRVDEPSTTDATSPSSG